MRIIHWEHNPAAMGRMSQGTDLRLSLGPMRSDESNTVIGIFCRWRCRLFSDIGQVVGFIAEQRFSIDRKLLTPRLLEEFVALSFSRFESIMSDELAKVDMEADLSFEIKDKQINDFLTELNRI